MARPFGNANKILQRARSNFDSVEEHNHEEPLFEVVMGMFAMVGLILLAGIAYLLYQPCKKHCGKFFNFSKFRKRRRQSLTPEMGQTFTKIGDHMLSMAHIFRQTSKINEPNEISIVYGSTTDERSSEVSDTTTTSQMEKMKIVFFKERGKVYVSPDIQAIMSDIKPKGDGPFYEVDFEHISSGFQSPVHSLSQSISNFRMRPSLSDGCHLGDQQLEPINSGLHYDRMMKSWYDLTTISDQQCEAAREQMKLIQQQSKTSERSDPTDVSEAYRRKYEMFRKQNNAASKQKEIRRCSTKKKKAALDSRSSGGKLNRLRGRDERKKCDPDQHDRKTTMLLNALRIPITKGFIS